MVSLEELLYTILMIIIVYVVWMAIQLIAGTIYDRREEKLRGLPDDVREIID